MGCGEHTRRMGKPATEKLQFGGFWGAEGCCFQNGIYSQIQDYRLSSKLHSLHGLENTWEKEIVLHDLIDIKKPCEKSGTWCPPRKDNSRIELACTLSHACPELFQGKKTHGHSVLTYHFSRNHPNTCKLNQALLGESRAQTVLVYGLAVIWGSSP